MSPSIRRCVGDNSHCSQGVLNGSMTRRWDRANEITQKKRKRLCRKVPLSLQMHSLFKLVEVWFMTLKIWWRYVFFKVHLYTPSMETNSRPKYTSEIHRPKNSPPQCSFREGSLFFYESQFVGTNKSMQKQGFKSHKFLRVMIAR